jgi:hypothetical protein
MFDTIDYHTARMINNERLRVAEKARKYRHAKKANGLSLFLKSLSSLVVRT